jgi:hypothetical protein
VFVKEVDFFQELDGGAQLGGARVHHVFTGAGRFALAFLVMVVFAALATLGVSLTAGSLRSAAPTPAEIVALRFPSPDAVLPVQPVTTFSTASVMPVEHWEKFDQDALSGIATAAPPSPTEAAATPTASETTEPLISQPAEVTAAVAETAKPEPPKVPAASAPAHRVASRSSNVLNDAQIASIRQRLKLTAEQQQMWPAVEAALRKIVYTKTALNPQTHGSAQLGGSSVAYIDPSSAEVRQLKSAALPLIMRLNDEQKREVKMLAYVMGLEAVASQF